MANVSPHDVHGADLPLVLMYEMQLQSTGRPWPCIYTEADFVLMLTSHVNCVWQMYQLANEVSGTAFRRATERIEIQRAHLEELDRKRMENAAAMKILRMAAGLTVKSTRKKTAANGRGRGGARGGRGCRARLALQQIPYQPQPRTLRKLWSMTARIAPLKLKTRSTWKMQTSQSQLSHHLMHQKKA